jgi:hypothetical protein
MFLKRGGGKFLKNSAATGGMIQKNDKPSGIRTLDPLIKSGVLAA